MKQRSPPQNRNFSTHKKNVLKELNMAVTIVFGLGAGFAISLFYLLGPANGVVSEGLDVGHVVVLSYVDPAHRPRYEGEAASDHPHPSIPLLQRSRTSKKKKTKKTTPNIRHFWFRVCSILVPSSTFEYIIFLFFAKKQKSIVLNEKYLYLHFFSKTCINI